MTQENMNRKTYRGQGYVRSYKKAAQQDADKKTINKTHILWVMLVLFICCGIFLLWKLPYHATAVVELLFEVKRNFFLPR